MTSSNDKVRVLFVCLGNICRSPLAEGVFRHQVQQAGLRDRFHIDSAGTSSYHEGDPPDDRTAALARQRGVDLTGRSRQITVEDLNRFDHIIVMDAENLAAVRRMTRGAVHGRVQLLREFDPSANGDLDVPDPYYGGPHGFEHVHDIVERSCQALLEQLRKAHALS